MALKAIYNIINKIMDPNIRLLYQSTESLFDHSFKSLPYYIYDNSEEYYNCYDAIIVNDWQKHAVNRMPLLSEHQIMDMLFFHTNCPSNFKKEDKAIFQNAIKTAYKIFLSADIYNSWNIKDVRSFQINYGVPIIDTNTYNKIDDLQNKKIIFLNTANRPEYINVFRHITKTYPNIEMISSVSDYENIIYKLCNASAVIDLQHGIHTLYAIMCGATMITNQVFDGNLKSPIYISNVGQIVPSINKAINISSDKALINSDIQYIISEYKLENFQSNICDIFNTIKTEPFLL